MRNCVMVARQTLTLFVWVRILVPQPMFGLDEESGLDFSLDLFVNSRCSSVWWSATFGTQRPQVRILSPRPLSFLFRKKKEKPKGNFVAHFLCAIFLFYHPRLNYITYNYLHQQRVSTCNLRLRLYFFEKLVVFQS